MITNRIRPSAINDEVLWRKNGTSFPVEYTVTPICRGTDVLGSVIAFRDITERLKAEKGDENAVDAATLNVVAHRLENLIHDRRVILASRPPVASVA